MLIMNTVINEYVGIHHILEIGDGWSLVSYERLANQGIERIHGAIHVGEYVLRFFGVPKISEIEDSPWFQFQFYDELPKWVQFKVARLTCNEELIIYWKNPPLNHYLAVSYGFCEEPIECLAPHGKWLQEGF